MQEMQQQMEECAEFDVRWKWIWRILKVFGEIIHGLGKLSFDQETLMKGFNELKQNDPTV